MTSLELAWLLPDSVALTTLAPLARQRGYGVTVEELGISVRSALPESWDAYLAGIDGKQRHEIRRKLRRLGDCGAPATRVVTRPEDTDAAMDLFLDLFVRSRTDKASFMTPAMAGYFRQLAREAAHVDTLRLFFLELDGRAIASAMTFAHGGTLYLYNNGYDPAARDLSPGLLVKVLSLRWAIEHGLGVYDFLRGAEPYKYQLGGREVRLAKCEIQLNRGGLGP
jgi:CelD/BcsL family acetyltransferase involved in cellulose biosynthesis